MNSVKDWESDMPKEDEQLDALIQRVIEPPADLATHIKQAVHCGNVPQLAFEHHRWWRSRVAVAAAVILLAGTLSALLIRGDKPQKIEDAETVAGVEMNKSETEHSLLLNDFDVTAARENYPLNSKANLVGLRSQQVATPRNVASVLPERVRHVWTVKNLEEARNLLQEIAKANGKKLTSQEDWITGKNSWVITVNDKELQSLVNKLQSREWNLFSQNAPQPYAPQQIQFTGKQVEYMLCILQEE